MQNAATAPVSPPLPPQSITTIQTTPSGVVQISTPQATRPLTQAEAQVLRNQRGEMSNQLTSAQGRREEILSQLRNAPPGTEQGLRDQYQVLSNRIVSIEQDIEASGRTLRTGQVPVGTTIIAPRDFGRMGPEAQAARGAAMAATVLVPVFFIYMIAKFRRWRRRDRTQATSVDHDARMERLEQAVDAIALEIERVGESQRYQSKLLAEANLMPAMSVGQKEPVRARDYDR